MLVADWESPGEAPRISDFSFVSGSVVNGRDDQIVCDSAEVFVRVFIVRGQVKRGGGKVIYE
jgi:hypothetical protein